MVADRLSQLEVFLRDSWDGMDDHLINLLISTFQDLSLVNEGSPVLQQHDTSNCHLLLLGGQE